MRKIAGVLGIVVVLVVGGAAPASAKDYKIGQTAKTDIFKVTVYGIQDPWVSTNQFDKPHAGNRFVAVDVAITNTSKLQARFSSLIGFHLLDADHHQYDEAFTTVSPKAPEGEVPPKETIRGFVSFEIPAAATNLRLRVQGSFTASGSYMPPMPPMPPVPPMPPMPPVPRHRLSIGRWSTRPSCLHGSSRSNAARVPLTNNGGSMFEIDLDSRFDYHKPDEARAASHEQVRATCKDAARTLVAVCPPGRELSSAIAALEEAMFWVNAAIARQ